jgi:hypothetical protein
LSKKKLNTPTKQEDARLLRQLIYYDIFDHLLTKDELSKDCSLDGNKELALKDLVGRGLIFQINGFYALREAEELAIKRQRGQANTNKSMPTARRMASRISKFPFVRAVALSGSISKGYMDSFKDIDFFIITKPGRLWLSRTLLVVYKKVFLINSFKHFCLNYFIDEENLEIRHKNMFTATEINTLIPMYGSSLLAEFNSKNKWVSAYYPDYPRLKTGAVDDPKAPALKRALEFIFSGFPGNWLDTLAMKFTVWYWKRKYRGDERYYLNSGFRFRKDEAKYHPDNFEHPVMKKYREKLRSFEREKNIELNDES